MIENRQQAIKDANAVRKVVKSKGWTEVLRPALEQRKNSLLQEFKQAKEFSDFVRLQQSVNAIENLLNYIEYVLSQGEQALKEYRKETGE